MFRVASISKLMCSTRLRPALKKNFSLCSVQSLLIDLKGSKTNYIPLSYFSSKSSDGDKQVCDKKDTKNKEQDHIKSHPSPSTPKQTSSTEHGLKLKQCKPVPIDPCRPPPIGTPKVPEIRQPEYKRQAPKPDECDDKAGAGHGKKGRNVFLGILFTAVTIGVLYASGIFDTDKKKKVVQDKVGGPVKKKREVIKSPAFSKDIPKDVPYLLIGGGTASFAAFRAIKSADPTAKVLVITNESHYPYMRPPLSKEIWFNDDQESVKKRIFKQWNGAERSLFYEPDDFYTQCTHLLDNPNGGVAIARGWSINKLDVIERTAELEDGSIIRYGKCLLATGATPKLSPVFQVAISDKNIEERVKIFRNIDDFEEVQELFNESKSVAIVGGGFLGSELACAIARKGKRQDKQIYQVFREGGNMGHILPEYLSYWTTDKIKNEGVDVLPRTEVLGIKSNGHGLELKLNNDKKLEVDFVIVAVGVEPNTELAKESDLEVDPELGGFLVNTELQARTDLYIAGDCACFYDPKLGRRRIEHHDNAVVTGRLAGENMAGARKPYLHQSMFWSDLGPDVGYEAIGVVDSSLPTVAVFAKAADKDKSSTVTDEGKKADTEVPKECEKYLTDEEKAKLAEQRRESSSPNTAEGEDFGKGVIFYLRDDIVVGIVLWNVFNRMSIARQVLKDQRKYEDINEVAKLFNIHEE